MSTPTKPAPTPSSDPAKPAAPNSRVVTKGLGAVVMRNEFYRDGYRVLQSIAVTQAVIICVLVFVMLYVVHINKKEYRYFATNENGTIMELLPLDEPTLSKPSIQAWAATAVTEIMTFGFNDYNKRFAANSKYFTPKGYMDFTTALAANKVIETVEQNRQLVSAIPGTAIVTKEGTVPFAGGLRYEWEIQIPLKITYTAVNGASTTQDRTVILRVVRASQLEMPRGIGIEQWIAR